MKPIIMLVCFTTFTTLLFALANGEQAPLHWKRTSQKPPYFDTESNGYQIHSKPTHASQNVVWTDQERSEQIIDEEDPGVILAKYDLEVGKWVCPRQREVPTSAKNASSSALPERGSMLSLTAARILDKDRDPRSYKKLLNQLTGLTFGVQQPEAENRDEPTEEEEAAPLQMMTLGMNVRNRHRITAERKSRPRTNDDDLKPSEHIPEAEPAFCTPELTTVALNQSSDPNVFLFPSCVRVHRCGGCCNHDLLDCQPTVTVMKKMRVMQATMKDAGVEGQRNIIVEVEEHQSCNCGCKIKDYDCNARQHYVPSQCRCICININEESICKSKLHDWFWNPDRCECSCKNEITCSTGLQFNPKTCSCT